VAGNDAGESGETYPYNGVGGKNIKTMSWKMPKCFMELRGTAECGDRQVSSIVVT